MLIIPIMIFIALYMFFTLPYVYYLDQVAKKNKEKADFAIYRAIQRVFRFCLFMSGVKLNVIGKENIPVDQAVLYTGNHRGIFDILSIYTQCPRPTGFVAKISLKKTPLLPIYMDRIGCLFMDRDDIKQSLKVILAAIDKVKKGTSICIFPEGTRHRDYDHPEYMLPFKEGSFKIATKTGCPIVPFAIIGSDQVMEAHFPWIKSRPITIVFGTPIDPKSLSKEEQKHIGNYVQDIVQGMLNEQLGITEK